MSRLIVVSNRVAPAEAGQAQAGGLAVGLYAALKEREGLWFGWSGDVVAAPPDDPYMFSARGVTFATLDLDQPTGLVGITNPHRNIRVTRLPERRSILVREVKETDG